MKLDSNVQPNTSSTRRIQVTYQYTRTALLIHQNRFAEICKYFNALMHIQQLEDEFTDTDSEITKIDSQNICDLYEIIPELQEGYQPLPVCVIK